jgi:hypothetical protein
VKTGLLAVDPAMQEHPELQETVGAQVLQEVMVLAGLRELMDLQELVVLVVPLE